MKYVRQHNKQPPIKDAWEHLLTFEPQDILAKLQTLAFRYRFNADQISGEKAIRMLADYELLLPVRHRIVLLQCYELLREHPGISMSWLDRVKSGLDAPDAGEDFIEQLWWGVYRFACGIVLEDEVLVDRGTDFYKKTIHEDLHPEGYLPKAVENRDERASLQGQLSAVQALVLMAEMAEHIGLDLWCYEVRAVGVLTAVTYPLYYYFYPEKWPWSGDQWKPNDGIPRSEVRDIFCTYSGFLEVSRHRYDRPLKAIKLILDELRPIYDMCGGGYTTLTHAQAVRRGLFG